jgi:2-polyprenyl-3-methyl-5-hydroxy-6-metoxy-1,4-benzoquinol methylase
MLTRSIADGGIGEPATERVYSNSGNTPLLSLLEKRYSSVLDIGCGAGNNAALIRSMNPTCDIFGITYSASEAAFAQKHMTKCWVADIEGKFPDSLIQSFDVLILSHVSEHLRDPAAVLARYSRLLRRGGQVLIAVPNILSWAMRLQFLLGDFRYQSSGVLDDTHLHYFTFFTADEYLLSKSTDLAVTHKTVSGSVPLWWLRRYVFSQRWSRHIDQWGCRHWPNLFGGQVLIRAVKQ